MAHSHKFKCSIPGCAKKYKYKPSLKRHVNTVHLSITFNCGFCSVKLKTKASRDHHILSRHTLETPFKCEQCPSSYSSKHVLARHQSVHKDAHTNKRDFLCTICAKGFFTKSHLTAHARTHSQDEDKFGSYFCKKRFNHQYSLKLHIRTHTQEKPFICPVDTCPYSSSSSSSLTSHTKARHSPSEGQSVSKIWPCYFCSKPLSRATTLANHIRLHTLETPFRCGLCQNEFATQKNLSCHISSHTMEKPFRCEKCREYFSSPYYLQTHKSCC